MVRTFWLSLILALVLVAPAVEPAAAQPGSELDLPPGIAKQAQPLIDDMREHMQQMGMSAQQIQMMMADMQMVVNQLPPGIFLQLLKIMPQLDMPEMMALHQQLHDGALLQQPPGQILRVARDLAR